MRVIYKGKRIKAMLKDREVFFKTVFMPESSLPEEPVAPPETTVLMEQNESGGLTYNITSTDYIFENGLLTVGGSE